MFNMLERLWVKTLGLLSPTPKRFPELKSSSDKFLKLAQHLLLVIDQHKFIKQVLRDHKHEIGVADPRGIFITKHVKKLQEATQYIEHGIIVCSKMYYDAYARLDDLNKKGKLYMPSSEFSLIIAPLEDKLDILLTESTRMIAESANVDYDECVAESQRMIQVCF
jgi:hypothetical protein